MPSGGERRRVLVVTKDPGLPQALVEMGQDVKPPGPVDSDAWISAAAESDVVVLDIDEPVAAMGAAKRLRQTTKVPVLLIPGTDEAWEGLDTGDTSVRVLTLPLNASSLSTAIAQVSAEHKMDQSAPVDATDGKTVHPGLDEAPPPPRPARSSPGGAASTPAKKVPDTTPPATKPERPGGQLKSKQGAAPPAERPPREAQENEGKQPRREPLPQASTRKQEQTEQPRQRKQGSAAGRTEALPVDRSRPPIVSGPLDAETALALAKRVAPLVPSLPHLPTVSLRIVDQVAAVVQADALALLVPDGDTWRVTAGQGLRRLEERAQLPADHWLVGEIVRAQHGVLIEDTDIARGRLRGAPLAHWRQLLGAPAREFNGVMLVGRDQPAFTEEELLEVVAILERTTLEIRAALEVRTLARQLEPFADRMEAMP